jgi:nucleoside-diphosphate-sugar epimerase
MKILVIGGTQFVGRHIVTRLLADGDDVTLFHRGLTNPGLFPDAEHLLGDRNSDLSALAAGDWDATIDTSAYFPRQVRNLASALEGRGGRYVHISSVSAYAEPLAPGFDEDASLAVLDDPSTEVVNGETYGGLKALCERASLEWFGGATAGAGQSTNATLQARAVPVNIVRPTYVVGPYDHSRRFTWWVERVARGGAVLAPGPKEGSLQVIDARDLADFVALLAHGRAARGRSPALGRRGSRWRARRQPGARNCGRPSDATACPDGPRGPRARTNRAVLRRGARRARSRQRARTTRPCGLSAGLSASQTREGNAFDEEPLSEYECQQDRQGEHKGSCHKVIECCEVEALVLLQAEGEGEKRAFVEEDERGQEVRPARQEGEQGDCYQAPSRDR